MHLSIRRGLLCNANIEYQGLSSISTAFFVVSLEIKNLHTQVCLWCCFALFYSVLGFCSLRGIQRSFMYMYFTICVRMCVPKTHMHRFSCMSTFPGHAKLNFFSTSNAHTIKKYTDKDSQHVLMVWNSLCASEYRFEVVWRDK